MPDLTSKLSKFQQEAFAKADKNPEVRRAEEVKVAKDSASTNFGFEYVKHESLTEDSLAMALKNKNTSVERLYKVRRSIPIEALNAKNKKGNTAAQLIFEYKNEQGYENVIAEFIEQFDTRANNLSLGLKTSLVNNIKQLIFDAIRSDAISKPEVELAISNDLLPESDIVRCAKEGILTDSLLNAQIGDGIKVYQKLIDSNIKVTKGKSTTIEKWINKKHPNIALLHKIDKELDGTGKEKISDADLIKGVNSVTQDSIQQVLYDRILSGDQAQYTYIMTKLFREYHSAFKLGDYQKADAISDIQAQCIDAVRIKRGHFSAEELEKQEFLKTALESSGQESRDRNLEKAQDTVWKAVFERENGTKGIDDKTILDSIVLLPCKEVETNFKVLKNILNHKPEYYEKHFKSDQNKSNEQLSDTKKENSKLKQSNESKQDKMDKALKEVKGAVENSTAWVKATVSDEVKAKKTTREESKETHKGKSHISDEVKKTIKNSTAWVKATVSNEIKSQRVAKETVKERSRRSSDVDKGGRSR